MYISLIKQMPEISKYPSLVGTCQWFSCDAVCVQFSFSLEVSALHHEMYSHIPFCKKTTLQGKLMYSYQKYINNATFVMVQVVCKLSFSVFCPCVL